LFVYNREEVWEEVEQGVRGGKGVPRFTEIEMGSYIYAQQRRCETSGSTKPPVLTSSRRAPNRLLHVDKDKSDTLYLIMSTVWTIALP